MRTLRSLALAAAFALTSLALTAGGAAAQPSEITPSGDYVHEGSGMTLPTRVGNWRRLDVYRFDTLATDVSSSYRLNLPQGSVLATVYVYPMPGGWTTETAARDAACTQEFEARLSEVVDYYDDVEVVSERAVLPPQRGDFDEGHWASFHYEADVSGRKQPVFSELYVYCYVGGPWAFEYRITRPVDLDAAKFVAAFMVGLTWTVEPGR